MADRTVLVRLKAEIAQYQAGMARAGQSTKEFGREITGMGKASRADIESVGRGALLMAGGLAVGLGLSAKAAIDWESAWAGVTKTVDGSASEMATLESGLRDLAKELPATHGEIAAVAEAAGQLGIQRGAIEGFTKTMIDLGETTNLTADQAATGLARMANIMQTPQADIERMASTLVELGNAGASTESEILDMSLRIAGAAKVVGITEAETLGFAEALSSVGVEAEAGGTAISRTFSTIASAVAEGGDAVAGFAEVAGMSSAEFSKAFRDDAAGATVAFIEGLGGITAAGGNVFAVLEKLELGDIRVRDALIRASGAGDMFRDSLARASKEWEVNNALQTEAEKRYDTTAAKLEIARNNVVDLGIDIGGVLLPAVAGAAEGASQMARGFGELPGPLQGASVGLAGVATAGLGVVGIIGTFGPKVKVARDALMGMGTTAQFVGRNMGTMTAALGVAGIALGLVSLAMGENAAAAAAAEQHTKGFTDAIREVGDAASGTETEIARLVGETPALAEIMDATGTSVADMTSALTGSEADFDAFVKGLLSAGDAAGVSGDAMAFTGFGIQQMRDAAQTGAVDAETLGRVLEGTGDAAEGAIPGTEGLAGALSEEEQAAVDAAKALDDLLQATLAQFDSNIGYRRSIDEVEGSLATLAETQAQHGTDSEEYRDALLDTEDALLTQADASLKLYEDTITAAGGTLTAADKSTIYRAELVKLRDSLAPGSPLRAALDGYIGQLDAIPSDKSTTVHVDVEQAMLNVATLAGRVGQLTDQYLTYSIGSVFRAQGGLIPHLAAGGFPGAPSGTDTVPTWLTPGEYVINARSTRQLGLPILNALNSMAGGGAVSPAAMFTGGGGASLHQSGGGTTIVNNYYSETIIASSIAEHHLARTVRDTRVSGGRRGIAA